MLRSRPDLEIICEASDGRDAVKQAAELQPELILLDIGLPALNGIEAAKQIRKVSSKSKIVFVTQELSPEVVDEAFRIGAAGFVAKVNARSEVSIAVDTVLRGRRFISKGLAPIKLPPSDSIPELHSEVHEVGFYAEDCFFLKPATDFVESAIRGGRACIVIATEAHRNSLLAGLHSDGLDVTSAIEKGAFVVVDAVRALSTFIVDGIPDESLFLEGVGGLIGAASKAAVEQDAPVAIYGEAVNVLWQQGMVEAAIQLEKLAHVLARRYKVEILCGYSVCTATARMPSQLMERISAEHSASHHG
jgi:CheY-like chemotaxis protein